jgi:hypothetical protein
MKSQFMKELDKISKQANKELKQKRKAHAARAKQKGAAEFTATMKKGILTVSSKNGIPDKIIPMFEGDWAYLYSRIEELEEENGNLNPEK